MPAEFTGEQKLRIVLESIIRGIPKEEQCKKYSITPEQFQFWHDHLIQKGGQIFEKPVPSNKPRTVKFVPWYIKLFLTFSLLTNLAVVIIFAVWKLSETQETQNPYFATLDQPAELEVLEETSPDISDQAKRLGLDELQEEVDALSQLGKENGVSDLPSPNRKNAPDIKKLLSAPLQLPETSVSSDDLASQVTFINETYEGKHVVYLIDVGSYQIEGVDGVSRMEKMKTEVLTSLSTLSANSYFNLVLCWNLREANALGKTILRASEENIRYATDWISSIGTDLDRLKEGRNQFYPKELLYAKPMAGIIGPWYGLATAMSFDPDLVFFLAGNMPSFPVDEVPSNHFNGLGLSQNQPAFSIPQTAGVSPLIRATARMWLQSIESRSTLPVTSIEVEEAALTRLGLDESVNPEGLSKRMEIPWGKVFDTFLASLDFGGEKLPRIHLFTTLPDHVTWPSALQKSMLEFTENSGGSVRRFVPIL